MNDILLFIRIQTTKKINGFFYFFQKIPLIGKLLKDSCYRSLSFKKGLSILAFIFQILSSVIKNALYLGIVIFLPLFLLHQEASIHYLQHNFLFAFILFSGVLGAITNSKIFQATKETYIMVRQLRFSSKRYMLVNAIYEYSLNMLTITLAALLLFNALKIPSYYAGIVAVIYVGMHLLVDSLYLQYFARKKKLLDSKAWVRSILSIFIVLLVYGSFYLKIEMVYSFIVVYLFFVIALFSCLYAYKVIKKYVGYHDVMEALLLQYWDTIFLDKTNKDTIKEDVAIQEKDYQENELKGVDSKLHGYEYLNDIFFKRHKRLLYKPMKRRMIAILVISLILCIVLSLKILEPINTSVLSILPFSVFILYITSIGERVCRAMFMNCDVALLHYAYYRQPKAILKTYYIRLKAIIRYNGITTLTLCICANFLILLAGVKYTLLTLLIFNVALICLMVFFSVHYLFIYYIFQPYNEELDMKNPFMSIVNWMVYYASYLCLQLEGNYMFAYGIIALTVLYVIVALLLVYFLAPRTFHLK